MCCRTIIAPLDRAVAELTLQIGQFRHETDDDGAEWWVRDIPEEGCSVHASMYSDDYLLLAIAPTIANAEHHHGKRITAGVYFEIAAKYGERVNGLVTQQSNVGECRQGEGVYNRTIAVYPDRPLLWENVCPGFQAELMAVEM